MAVALTFPLHPPLGGGQVRVYNLYRELARTIDIEVVTLGPAGTPQYRRALAPGMWEHRVPKSPAHAAAETALEQEAGTVVTDVAMSRLYGHTPDYLAALRAASQGADAIVASHPYTYQAIRAVTDIPLCYEAHNVEASLKAEVLTNGDAALSLLAEVTRTEGSCCREAELVWTCSAADRIELIRRYHAAPQKLVVVPNGAALDELPFTSVSSRQEHRRRLRMEERYAALFIASWHQPNIEAALRMLALAEHRPAVDFLVVGSVGLALADRRLPDNVQLAGAVTAEFKQAVLSVADVALNPVTTGSGTNIKMMDYFSSGVPVISTTFGARGLGVVDGEHYVQSEPGEFDTALDQLREFPRDRLESLTRAARDHVEAELSWSAIADALLVDLHRALGDRIPGVAAASARVADAVASR